MLEARRHALGLSRKVLAEKAGLAPRTIYDIERAGVQPRRATKLVLSWVLGTTQDELFPKDTALATSIVQQAGLDA